MDSKQMAAAYKHRQIMTATPDELTLMLYNGAIRFGLECRKALEEQNYEAANTASLRIQSIIGELSNTLKMEYPISKEWKQLYEYITYTLVQANIKKDVDKLDEAMNMVREFRDTWQIAMKTARAQNAAGQNAAGQMAAGGGRWA